MKLIINGEWKDVHNAQTVMAVANELSYNIQSVAVALNGDFVARSQYGNTNVKEGDTLEIVSPIAGG